ncbi:MAG: hypothetical protein RLZZ325_1128, partial [Pseudomonadota bacterium]
MALWRYASLIKEKLFSGDEGNQRKRPKGSEWESCVQEDHDENSLRISKIASDIGNRPLRINAGPDEHLDWLMQTIETNVIPRLLMTHSSTHEANRSAIMNIRLDDQNRVKELT